MENFLKTTTKLGKFNFDVNHILFEINVTPAKRAEIVFVSKKTKNK